MSHMAFGWIGGGDVVDKISHMAFAGIGGGGGGGGSREYEPQVFWGYWGGGGAGVGVVGYEVIGTKVVREVGGSRVFGKWRGRDDAVIRVYEAQGIWFVRLGRGHYSLLSTIL